MPDPTRALLARLLRAQARGAGTDAGLPLRRRDEDGPAPLSAAQLRLRLLHELDPQGATYNEALAVRLRGDLDLAALDHGIREIARRHQILRSTFPIVDGEPVQIDTGQLPGPLDVTDLPVQAGDSAAAALAMAETFARQPFDLTARPPFRCRVIRLAPRDHLLVIVCHHIVADHWAMALFIDELCRGYTAFTTGVPPSLPDLPLQCADFGVWQRQWLATAEFAREREAWTRVLAGAPLSLDLPTDRPRRPVWSTRGGHVAFTIPSGISAALAQLAARERCTPYMVLLAAFACLLHRYARQDDVLIGTAVAGRDHVALERLIGFFLNSLVLRSRYEADLSFRAFLARCRETCLEAFDHQRMPFEQIVEQLNPPREGGRNPVFQAMLILQTAPTRAMELPGLAAEMVRLDFGVTKLDLYLFIEPTRDGALEAVLRYSAALWDRDSAERLAANYQALLTAAVQAPETSLHQLPIMASAERAQVLDAWNQTREPVSDGCVHELVSRQVRRTPDAVAVECAGRTLTYGELEARAHGLAALLQHRGVTRGALVAIALPRSVDLLVAWLATLKAGAAYLPLDPRHPSARLRGIVDDAGPSVLLTDARFAARFPTTSTARPMAVVTLDVDEIRSTPPAAARASCTPDALAYVLYTSGSTGRPKGVAIPHRAVVNVLESMRKVPGLTPADVLVAITTVSFDIAGLELLLPVTCGARVVIADEETVADPLALMALLEASRATIMQATPATWRMLIDAGWNGSAALHAWCGGEALPADLVMRLGDRCAVLWNLYGPTETTIWSTVHRVSVGEDPVSIGRPIANTSIFILDRQGAAVPIGVPGELFIGGLGLARGYLHRPALTAERFVPHPFSASGERLYRTGDMVRWRANGTLEYLGRADHQIKIRGFRVEPGEIEHVLHQQPGVRQAAVVAREQAPGDVRLVAYVVAEPDVRPDVRQLRAALQAALPDYMRPSIIEPIDVLPLTPNGKVDRGALRGLAPSPAAGGAGAEADPPVEPPLTPVEQVLIEIWAAVLGRESVGRHDDFFLLGGHSLLATRLLSRVRERLGVQLSARFIFESPTVADMAAEVERQLPADAGATEEPWPPIGRVARDGPLPLSFGQQRLWVVDKLQSGNTAYNVATAVRLTGDLVVSALERSLNAVIARHEALRTAFPLDRDGNPVQQIVPALRVSLSVEDLRGRAHAGDLARRMMREVAVPFDLARAPLLRALLWRASADEHVLLFLIHHIIFDGWSAGVLLREIATFYAYDGTPAAAASRLPALDLQYADYTLWQRAALRGAALDRHLDFWRAYLRGAPATLAIDAFDRDTFAAASRGAQIRFQFDARLTHTIDGFSRAAGVTPFMTAFAAFALVLASLSGQDDLTIGTDVAGRVDAAIEPLIGFFTNQIVLRANLSAVPAVSDLLARVRESTLQAFSHADTPFNLVVDALLPDRRTEASPLFQAKLVLQDLSTPEEVAPGLRIELLPVEAVTARFDLLLNLSRARGRLFATLSYRTAFLGPDTASRIADLFELAIREVTSDRQRSIAEIKETLAHADRERRLAGERAAQEAALEKLAAARRRHISLTTD